MVDNDVEVAPIYRHGGKADEPKRLSKNHDLHIYQEDARPENHCKQPALAQGVPITGSLTLKQKILGMQ